MRSIRTIFRVRGYVFYLSTALLFVASLTMASLTMMKGNAAAYGQIADRSLTLSSGIPSATNVTYTFTFTLKSTLSVDSLKFVACENAVGTYPTYTCTPPHGMSAAGEGFSAGSVAVASQTGWQGTGSFAVDTTGGNDCSPGANVLCVKRTDGTPQTATSRTISFSGVTNPDAFNNPSGTPFFVGIYTYSDSAYTAANLVDFGATASAVVQSLTTNAAVAEVLNFCVGATTVDDTTTSIASDCNNVSGTSVNIGTLDTSAINVSPVAVNGGNNQNGVAMVRSNALNGLTISYDAIPSTSVANGDTDHLGTLRLSGVDCDATNTFTDGCINAAGTTINNFTAGQEEFGMTVAGVNSGSTSPSSYTCAYGDTHAGTPIAAGNTCSLEPTPNYLGGGSSGLEDYYRQADGLGNGFAWDDTGAATQIATASRAVDDEALILKFAATPSITTPFGPYSVQSDYIVVATY